MSDTSMLRVVLVDDNHLLLAAMLRFLGRHYDVRAAGVVDDARALIRSWRPHAVICDLRLHDDEAGGVAVLEAARDLAPEAQRILVTGADVPDAARAVAHRVLQKPLSPRALLAEIEVGQGIP